MVMRHKNSVWGADDAPTVEGASMCILQDIRDELQAIRRLMECPNVQAGFIAMQQASKTLKAISKKIPKK